MKGQKLFIRPVDDADRPAVATFLAANGRSGEPPAWGLLGRLVGDLVAVVAMRITHDAVEIDDVVVASHLRRKRIARAMLDEAERIAAKMEKARLVSAVSGAEEFLRRVGFERKGERWIRDVRTPRG